MSSQIIKERPLVNGLAAGGSVNWLKLNWEKLLSRAEPGSELAREVAANIGEARQLGGIKVAAKAASQASPGAKPQPQAPGASVDGSVTLSRELAGKAVETNRNAERAAAVVAWEPRRGDDEEADGQRAA